MEVGTKRRYILSICPCMSLKAVPCKIQNLNPSFHGHIAYGDKTFRILAEDQDGEVLLSTPCGQCCLVSVSSKC